MDNPQGIAVNQRFLPGLVVVLLAGIGASKLALADNTQPTNDRERFFLKRQNYPWTEEMGKSLYACLKKNDGFNASGCHLEAIDAYCPADENGDPRPGVVKKKG